jgi:hypothetical protein
MTDEKMRLVVIVCSLLGGFAPFDLAETIQRPGGGARQQSVALRPMRLGLWDKVGSILL